MRQPWTEQEQAILIKRHKQRWGVARIAAALGRTPSSIYSQTRHLKRVGRITSQHKSHWRDDEQRLLLAVDAGVSVGRAAAQIGRSANAALNRLTAHGISPQRHLSRIEGMSAADVARELGTTKWFVNNCIRRGWLRATRRTIVRKVVYSISPHDVFAFIRAYGGYVPLNPNEDWRPYVAVEQARFAARYISRRALAALLYVCSKVPRRLERDEGLPQPALRLHQSYGGDYYERTAVAAWLDTHPAYRTRAAKEAGL